MKTLKLIDNGRVQEIVLNRPNVRNAFSSEMISELTEVFGGVTKSKDPVVIILRGEGKSFCAGADIGYMKSMADFTLEENKKDAGLLFDMFESIANCPFPVLAKVHGHVMGGALGLIAACDMVAAQRDTKFAFSEVKIGLVPSTISPFVLRKARASAAIEEMLTGESFSAEKAVRMGLVQYVGSDEEIEDYVFGRADLLCSGGPNAVVKTKEMIQLSLPEISSEVREKTINCIAEARVSKEGQEGLTAFFEKRKPSWVE